MHRNEREETDMKKYRYFLILLSVILTLTFCLGAKSNENLSSNQTILSSSEIEALNRYDGNLKDNEMVLFIKEHGYLESFIQRLDSALDQKIENELSEKTNQIEQWGLNPEDNLKNLEDKVQKYLNENNNGIVIGTLEFELLLDKCLSNGASGIACKAKSDPSMGQIYLYMCIYKNYHKGELTATSKSIFSDQYYNKSLKEICCEDIIQDFVSTDSLSILRSFIEEMNLDFSPPWPALNGSSIQTYARTWAMTRNSYYLWYEANNDCTDFASQALFYGGLYMTYYSSDQTANGLVSTPTRWFYFNNSSQSGYSISTSFIRVLELYNYLAPHYATFSTTNSSTMTTYLNKGFLLQGKPFIGDYAHSVVITLVSGSPRYCAHSNCRYDEPIATFYNGYYQYRVVQVY